MSSLANPVTITPLKPTFANWKPWVYRMKAMIAQDGLTSFIDGTLGAGALDSDGECKSARVLGMIFCSIEDGVFDKLSGLSEDKMKNPLQVWKELHRINDNYIYGGTF